MTLADLFRELARPARHDHRRLTPGQHALENIARAAAHSLLLAAWAAAQAANRITDTAHTIRVAAHLWRDQ